MHKKQLMKFVVVALLLGVAMVLGLLFRYYCHRFPTEQEMRDYHEAHFPTKLEKLESKQLTKKDGTLCVVFKGLHRPSGVAEVYHVEAGKRWVLPWESYNWKNEKESDE